MLLQVYKYVILCCFLKHYVTPNFKLRLRQADSQDIKVGNHFSLSNYHI